MVKEHFHYRMFQFTTENLKAYCNAAELSYAKVRRMTVQNKDIKMGCKVQKKKRKKRYWG